MTTRLLYDISSVAVKVDSALRRSSPIHLAAQVRPPPAQPWEALLRSPWIFAGAYHYWFPGPLLDPRSNVGRDIKIIKKKGNFYGLPG
jgi:hypothetical protein